MHPNDLLQPVYPDESRSNLTIISSILESYGAGLAQPTCPEVDRLLKERPRRNLIFLLLDGMGSAILDSHLPAGGFLHSHKCADLTAVYPSTTVCVTSSFFSGIPPISHAWLAWQLYFAEWDQCIEMYSYRDAYFHEPVDLSQRNFLATMEYESIFARIERIAVNAPEISCIYTDITRRRLTEQAGERLIFASDFESLLMSTAKKCAEPGDHLIFAYWKSPDAILHPEGPRSETVTAFMESSDELLHQYTPTFADANLIVTADHGMLEMNNHFSLDQYPDLDGLLRNYPAGDGRAKMLYVQNGKEDLFAARFQREFGNEFMLLSADEVLNKGLLGSGPIHPRTRGFLGDFLAIGISRSDLVYQPEGARPPKLFLGHHAGLTAAEMMVPLILYG
jgi:predicted AlkP superfamily pyrophosphatase or phosphodiesterase